MRLYILGLAQKEEKRVELWPHMLRSVLQIHGKDKPNHKLRVLSWTLLSHRWEQINRPVCGASNADIDAVAREYVSVRRFARMCPSRTQLVEFKASGC